jgi:predicted choloylglycine hydrolase
VRFRHLPQSDPALAVHAILLDLVRASARARCGRASSQRRLAKRRVQLPMSGVLHNFAPIVTGAGRPEAVAVPKRCVLAYHRRMLKRFEFAREGQPDRAWLKRFMVGRAEAERWYLGAKMAPPPTAPECRAALVEYMPDLLPQYDRVRALVGDDERAHQILSHYRPAPEFAGCSHAVWHGVGGPALVRNYDFNLDVVTDRFEATSWFGREVIAKAQRPWGGCLDGMNEDGLVASMTFGGSPAQARGFAIILVLRYVLEMCRDVGEAIRALRRIPIAQSHNVTVLDKSGRHATLFLGPDRTPTVTNETVCTNHQEKVV